MNKNGSILLLLCASCGGGFDIAEGNLAGTVAGKGWLLASGITNDFLSDESSYWVELYGGDDKFTCDTIALTESVPMVLVSIPKTLGEHELNFDLFGDGNLTVTVVPSAGENIILTEGVIDVQSITDGVIRAGMYATDESGDYELSGHFEVSVCP